VVGSFPPDEAGLGLKIGLPGVAKQNNRIIKTKCQRHRAIYTFSHICVLPTP